MPAGFDPGPLGFHASVSQGAEGSRLVVRGELDIAGESSFFAAAESALKAGKPIEVDLRELSFVDSSGVRCLVLLDEQAKERTGEGVMLLAAPRGEVRRVLELTRIPDLIGLREREGG